MENRKVRQGLVNKVFKIAKRVLIATILTVIVGVSLLYTSMIWWPGLTPKSTAKILVHDPKFGMRAVKRAQRYGDKVLTPLRVESNNFKLLDNRNSFWIATVLGNIKTEKATELLHELYGRKDTLPRLVRAIGLAMQGSFPEPIEENSFIIQALKGYYSQYSDGTEKELAAIALGESGKKKATPYLIAELRKKQGNYGIYARLCEALEKLGDRRAVGVLEECLQREDFHALSEAFRALIALGDRNAVPLVIQRINPSLRGYNAGFVVQELKKVTGVNYGYNGEKWQAWWEKNKQKWEIPDEYPRTPLSKE